MVYESKQSYYDLFEAAGISAEVNHKIKPQSRPGCCCSKKKEIETLLANHRSEIETGKLRVLLIDQCHLMWGDLSGYVWGKTDLEIAVPVVPVEINRHITERLTISNENYCSKPTMPGIQKILLITCDIC